MIGAKLNRLAELFETARELDGEQRTSFLTDACGNDLELRQELISLLRHHDSAGGGLDESLRLTPSVVPELLSRPVEVMPPPRRIGQYDIEELIGEGGMGAVFRARQHHPPRTVALKVIRNGRLSRELIRRFEFEAAVLAQLNHPGIAQIHEAGVFDDGGGARPFFAMEFVDGEPLSTYLQSRSLDVREKLALFIRIADAVSHAHLKGVIHRDLKPANVLVTHDGQPKILDFGVARATDSDRQVTTLQTETRQLVGTLPYMSPEQVEGNAAELDTRSDVYALGVLLYEMIAGRLPYDLQGKSISAAGRAICEQAPRRLAQIDRAIPADLNTIVLKALEKDPEQRYQSASDFAADVQRVLRHEPITARPATAWYRALKFARRNTGLVSFAAMAAIALVGGLIATALALVQARHEADRAGAINQFMSDVLTDADPNRTRAGYPFIEVLDGAGDLAADRFAGHPDIEAEIRIILARAYTNLSQWRDAELHSRVSWELRRDSLGPAHQDTVRSQYLYMQTLKSQMRVEEAEQVGLQILELIPATQRESLGAIHARRALANIQLLRGNCDAPEVELRDCLRAALEHYGPDHLVTLHVKKDLIVHLIRCQTQAAERGIAVDYAEPIALLHDVIDGFMALDLGETVAAVDAVITLARALRKVDRLDEAEQYARQAAAMVEQRFGAQHGLNVRVHRQLADILYLKRKFDEAADAAATSVQVALGVFGPGHPNVLSPMSLALPMLDAARADQLGEQYSRELDERLGGLAGHDIHSVVRYKAWLARFLTRQGRFEEASELIQRANDVIVDGVNDETRALLGLAAGQMARESGDFNEAERQLLRALELSPPSPLLDLQLPMKVSQELAWLYDALDLPEKAEPYRTAGGGIDTAND